MKESRKGLKRKIEIIIVYMAGVAQGLCMVSFPALGTILTSPKYYSFTNTEYGDLFIPMATIVS